MPHSPIDLFTNIKYNLNIMGQNGKETNRTFYVDTAVGPNSGFLNTTPTRGPVDEVLSVGIPRTELQRTLDEEARMIGIYLEEQKKTSVEVTTTHRFARRTLKELLLPEPGLIDLGNQIHTGWFYIRNGSKTFIAYRAPINGEEEYKLDRRPYFALNAKQSSSWDSRVKTGPLDIREFKILAGAPDERISPQYETLCQMNLAELIEAEKAFVQNFRKTVNPLIGNGHSDKLARYIPLFR